jgi:hypothetical protein
MPNGHGGIPKYGSPALLFVLYLLLFFLYAVKDFKWAIYATYPVVILLGERLAHHIYLYDVTSYSGACATDEMKRKGDFNYRRARYSIIIVGILVTTLIWAIAGAFG